MRARIDLDVVDLRTLILAKNVLSGRGFRVIGYGEIKPTPVPPETCFECGGAFATDQEIVRHHVLDGNGFGRMSAPFHDGCDSLYLERMGW